MSAFRDRYFDESDAGRRRLVVLLYLLAAPLLVLHVAATAAPVARLWSLLAMVAIALAGLGQLHYWRAPGPYPWVFPTGVAPVLLCGIAMAAGADHGHVFFALLGVPIALSAISFQRPTVIAALTTGTLVCFFVAAVTDGIVSGLIDAPLFAIGYGLVAWVARGRSSRSRDVRLRTLERHLNDIEYMVRPDGAIVDANDRAAEAYGYTCAELLGMNLRSLCVASEDVDGRVAEVLARGTLVFESEHRRRDGTSLPVEVSSRVCEVDGQRFIHSLARDITARRAAAAERRFLSALVDHLPDAVIVTDPSYDIVMWSRGAERIFGYTKEDVLGQPLSAFVDERPSLLTSRAEIERSWTGSQGAATRIRKDGKGVVTTLELAPLRDEEGVPTGVLAVSRDVTTEHEMNAALRASEAGLRDALASEKRFLATMSHEIRTPLNGVIGFLDLLAARDIEGPERGWLEKALISARHLLSLIDDILDVSKIDAGQIELTRETFDVDEVLRECVAMVSSRVHADVELSLAPTSATHEVAGDPRRVRQIVLNLLGNAAKFTERGKIDLSASLAVDGGRARLSFDVTDTGVGIAPERLATLFQQFRQAHGSRYGGTGLGLFLCRALARKMGGEVTASSAVGVGSRFHVEIDLAVSARRRSAARAHRDQEAPSVRNADLATLRVLVVDDVPMNIAVVQELFRVFFGCRPSTAVNGREAVDRVRAEDFELVLMDLQMPVMNGVEATSAIRALGLDVPIVAMTASAIRDELQAAMDAGMNGFLVKPVRRPELERALRTYARRAPRREPSARDRVVAYFEEMVGKEGARELCDLSVASLAASVASLREARASADGRLVARELHKIKGALQNCGMADLAEQAASLEQAILVRSTPSLAPRADALEAALDRFVAG